MRRTRIRPAPFALIALAGLSLTALGCGGSGPAVYPVRGEVFVQGRPAVGAAVTFYLVKKVEANKDEADLEGQEKKTNVIPTAVVDADGSFRLTSLRAYDGAPAGDYTISITWSDSWREDGETRTGPDKLRRRYADPNRSGLKVCIKSGKNQLTRFDLN